MKDIYEKIKEDVKEELSGSAHDFEHTLRVFRLASSIAESKEDVDMKVLKSAALLHDIAREREDEDVTGDIDHAVLGAEMADDVLKGLDFTEREVKEIWHCIRAHRFRGEEEPKTKEAKILSDADKLDAIGAVGVARCFTLAGEYGEKLYSDIDLEEYKRQNLTENGRLKDISKHAPNIEYEIKLKRIPDRIYTEEGKKIASKRMDFMEDYFERLEREIKGGR